MRHRSTVGCTGFANGRASARLLAELIYGAFLANYRHAAYDGWAMAQLTERMGKQVDVILAGAISRQ